MIEPFDPNTIPGLFNVTLGARAVHNAINKQMAATENAYPGMKASLCVIDNGQTFFVKSVHDDGPLLVLTCHDEEGRLVKLLYSHTNLSIRITLSEKQTG